MVRAVDVRVTGQVQGVAFRAYAVREARRLRVSGWVRNADDGAVLSHVEGADEAVGEMVVWLESGPPDADVAAIEVSDATVSGATSFEVVR